MLNEADEDALVDGMEADTTHSLSILAPHVHLYNVGILLVHVMLNRIYVIIVHYVHGCTVNKSNMKKQN